jgi:hypothetical protein
MTGTTSGILRRDLAGNLGPTGSWPFEYPSPATKPRRMAARAPACRLTGLSEPSTPARTTTRALLRRGSVLPCLVFFVCAPRHGIASPLTKDEHVMELVPGRAAPSSRLRRARCTLEAATSEGSAGASLNSSCHGTATDDGEADDGPPTAPIDEADDGPPTAPTEPTRELLVPRAESAGDTSRVMLRSPTEQPGDSSTGADIPSYTELNGDDSGVPFLLRRPRPYAGGDLAYPGSIVGEFRARVARSLREILCANTKEERGFRQKLRHFCRFFKKETCSAR